MRDEQSAAIGTVDLALMPIGAGPTIGANQAADVAARVDARWIVPHHYRTARIDFLEPAADFVALYEPAVELDTPRFDTDMLPIDAPTAVVPAAPWSRKGTRARLRASARMNQLR